jgi:hypothetical protein
LEEDRLSAGGYLAALLLGMAVAIVLIALALPALT